MLKERHLTDEALTLLAGGQLGQSHKQRVNDHLQTCPTCRSRLQDTRRVHSLLESFSEVGLAHVLRVHLEKKQPPLENRFRFPWTPVSAILAGVLLVIVFLSVPKTIPEASASELLIRSVKNEGAVGLPQAFQIRLQGNLCAQGTADTVVLSQMASTSCAQATGLVRKSLWGIGNPLSARTFRNWHDALSDRRDTVTKGNSSWTIDTMTSSGFVRQAALTMTLTDYRPLSLQLKFDNEQEVTISEGTYSLFEAASRSPLGITPRAPAAPVDDPADVLEVHAWQVLQNVNADSGWEANLVRIGSRVILRATISDDIRKHEILDAFRQYPDIELDIRNGDGTQNFDFLPQRQMNGDSLPLAHTWLQAEFPDSASRNHYVNATLQLSKDVLGRAFILDELRKRRRSIGRCSCAAQLAKVIERESDLLEIVRKELASATQPLTGSGSEPQFGRLEYKAAQRLDLALAHLLAASSSQSSLSYNDDVEILRQLL